MARSSLSTRLFCSHFVAVLLVSGSIGTFFYYTAKASLVSSIQTRLQNSAALLSRSLNAATLETVRTEADTAQPAYQRTLQTLREYAAANPDIAFLYIMRKESERVVFVVDSDESPSQAAPGKVYEATTPWLWQGFTQPSVDQQVSIDPWGSFISGYAPLKDGQGKYLIGIDMRADQFATQLRDLQLAALFSLGAAVVLALICSRLLARHFYKPLRSLVVRCREAAAGRLQGRLALSNQDVELDQLIQSFNHMMERLDAGRVRIEQTNEALEKSRKELELRVERRTQELAQLNRQLMREVQERKHAQESLQEAARTDPLTGLLNRRAVRELLEYEAGQTRRQRVPFCIVLGDLDRFKRVNDEYGHAMGDLVLVQVAKALRQGLREQDTIARWGGEELLLLLPHTGLAHAQQVAEKIRAQIADLTISGPAAEVKVTISMGVSEFNGADSIDECIGRADHALYQAKMAGRNMVMAATAPAAPTLVLTKDFVKR